MKNKLKVLVALLLALLCVLACASCEMPQPNPDPNPGVDENEPPVEEEVYKIKFVYSYTTIANNRVKKEVADVATVSIPVTNTGLTAEHRAQIDAISYNGYKFVDWYAEWDTNEQMPKGDAYVFGDAPITADITLYGYRSNMAGPSVTWNLVEETYVNNKGKEETKMTLTISGIGAMYDFANANDVDIPWYSSTNAGKITDIVVDEGVTHIGMNAFAGLVKAKNISLPESLISIGESSFNGATAMTVFNAPSNLQVIGKNAFKGATGLTKVFLNEGLTTIADSAFYGAYSIKIVLIPSTLKSIGVGAFHQGDGKKVADHGLYKSGKVYYNVPAENCGCENGHDTYTTTHLLSEYIDIGIDNVTLVDFPPMYFYTEDEALGKTGSYWYTSTKTGEPTQYCYALKYYLPSGFGQTTPIFVDYVPVSPLINENGEFVDAQGNVLEEGADPVLRGQLTQANVDFADPAIREFDGYKFDTLGTPDTFTVGAYITGDMKYNCTRGKILSDGGGIIWHTDAKAKSGNTPAVYAPLYVSLNPDAPEGASKRIWDFKTVAATGALWVNSQANLALINGLVIEEGVEYIGALTFYGLTNVTEVVIPASVTEIHPDAFASCSSLLSIYYMGEDLSACQGIEALTGIKAQVYAMTDAPTAADGGYWMEIDGKMLAWTLTTDEATGEKALTIGGDSAMIDFASASDAPWYEAKDAITSVSFTRNIRSLGKNAINGYSNVYSLSLPNDLKYIPRSALDGTGIITDTTSEKSQYVNGVLVINNHILRVDPVKRNQEVFETPIASMTIAEGAFSRCDKIKAVYITGTIQYVNKGAFDGSGIERIYVEYSADMWKNATVDMESVETITVYEKLTGSTAPADGFYWQKNAEGKYVIYGCTHSWSDWTVVTPATCKADGLEQRVCEHCDATIDRTIAKIADHVYGEFVIDERESCLEDYTKTRTCIHCGDEDTRFITGSAEKLHLFLADDWTAYEEVTCYSLATEIHYCQNEGCAVSETREVGELLPHVFETYVYQNDATCYENGHYLAHCENAGCVATDSMEREGSRYTEHDWQQIVDPHYLALRATVSTPDIYYLGCSHCDDVNATETFEVKGTELKYYTYDADRLLDVKHGGPILDTDSGLVLDDNSVLKSVYAATVIQGIERMIEFGKYKSAADSGFTIAAGSAVDSENAVYVIATDLRAGEFVAATDSVYLFSAAFVADGDEIFTIYFCDGGDGKLAIKTDLEAEAIATVDFSAFVTVRAEYFTELLSEQITPEADPESEEIPEAYTAYYNVVKLYVGDATVELKAYVDAEFVAPEFEGVRFATAKGLTSGKFYIDNTYVATVDAERCAVENNPNPATPDEGEGDGEGDGEVEPPVVPEIPGKVTFDENAEVKDGVVLNPAEGVVTTPMGGFISSSVVDGALNINAVGNPMKLTSKTAFSIAAADVEAPVYVFEANLVVTSGIQRVIFTDDAEQGTFGIEIRVCTPEEGAPYVEITEYYEGSDTVNVLATGLALDGFVLRIELYKDAFDGKTFAKIFVDGAYASTSDAVAYDGKKPVKYDITKVVFYHGKESGGAVVDAAITISDVQAAVIDGAYVPEIPVAAVQTPAE